MNLSFSELMNTAVQKNKFKFVKLLLDNNFALKPFLTYKRLFKLYNNVNITFELNLYNI